MKITFEFDTDSESFQRDEYERILKADDMCAVLWDLEQKIRGWYNHPERHEPLTDENLSKFFYGLLDDKGINLDRLWP